MEKLTQDLAYLLSTHITLNTDADSSLHKYKPEALFGDIGNETCVFNVISQFKSINQTSGFELKKLKGAIVVRAKIINLYTISNKNDDSEVSNAQIYNMNLNSGYNIAINRYGKMICNIFFNERYLHIPISKLSEKDTGLFLANLRYACMHIMKFCYPHMDQKFSNIAGAVMAVGVAKEMQILFTPTLLGHYLEVTPQLAEAIIDKYDAENHCYIGIPWIF